MRIGDNALRAVAASRPDMSRDIVSEPQRSVVRESGDTYCDLTGVKTNLTAAGEYRDNASLIQGRINTGILGQVSGTQIRLFVSRGNFLCSVRSTAC
jgi:hypothetical protein